MTQCKYKIIKKQNVKQNQTDNYDLRQNAFKENNVQR